MGTDLAVVEEAAHHDAAHHPADQGAEASGQGESEWAAEALDQEADVDRPALAGADVWAEEEAEEGAVGGQGAVRPRQGGRAVGVGQGVLGVGVVAGDSTFSIPSQTVDPVSKQICIRHASRLMRT